MLSVHLTLYIFDQFWDTFNSGHLFRPLRGSFFLLVRPCHCCRYIRLEIRDFIRTGSYRPLALFLWPSPEDMVCKLCYVRLARIKLGEIAAKYEGWKYIYSKYIIIYYIIYNLSTLNILYYILYIVYYIIYNISTLNIFLLLKNLFFRERFLEFIMKMKDFLWGFLSFLPNYFNVFRLKNHRPQIFTRTFNLTIRKWNWCNIESGSPDPII